MPLALGLQAEHVHHLIEELAEPDLVAIEPEAPASILRDVEQPVDQARQCSALRRMTRDRIACAAGLDESRSSSCA